uniref:SUEL-type lectin domain-containing protein n=2 Tax=Macrostomum lignano TaxID=282301 RepID=A0A1I8JL58_9PLAT
MAGFRAVLPLCVLCCLLAAIAVASADDKGNDRQRSHNRLELRQHSHRRPHRPHRQHDRRPHRPHRQHDRRPHRPHRQHDRRPHRPHRQRDRRPHRPHRHHGHHRRHRVRVRTACHGRTLRLGCRNGYKIRVLDAFYGRYSARICPKLRFKHGHRKLDSRIARCSAKNSRNEARRLCQGKRRCRLEASKKIFGKPCSSKERPYLRVRYTCVFRACRRVVLLQAKLVQLIVRYGRLAKHSYGYWRRKHFRHRKLRLKRKLNKLRRRFRFCFKCRRGCDKIRKLLSRIKRAEKRIQSMLKKLKARKKTNKKKSSRRHLKWHAGRWFLRRKLAYMRARRRMVKRKLKLCKRVCRY